MGFINKLFGKENADIQKVYMYVSADVPMNDDVCTQIRTYALQQLKADTVFRKTMERIEEENVPIITGHGVATSAEDFARSFPTWLKTQGVTLENSRKVMGKKIFMQTGSLQNPADGSQINWGLMGCYF